MTPKEAEEKYRAEWPALNAAKEAAVAKGDVLAARKCRQQLSHLSTICRERFEQQDGPGEEDGPWADGWNERAGMSWKECCRKEYFSAIEWAGKCQALQHELDVAVQMLADWCNAVRDNGTGWDDWDEYYKDAAYRPCDIRKLIDAARGPEKDE